MWRVKGTTLRSFSGVLLVAAGCALLLSSARAQGSLGLSKSSSSWGSRSTNAQTTAPRSVASGGASSWGAGKAGTGSHGGSGGVWSDGTVSSGAARQKAAAQNSGARGLSLAAPIGLTTPTGLATPTGLMHIAPARGHSGSSAGTAPMRSLSVANHPSMGAHASSGAPGMAAKGGPGMRRTSTARGVGRSGRRVSLSESGNKSGNSRTGLGSGSTSGLSSGLRSPLESESGLKSLVGKSQSSELGSELHTLSGETPH